MRITIAAVGRLRDAVLRAPYDDYVGRLGWSVALKEVEEKRKLTGPERMASESRLLAEALPAKAVVVALDPRGKTLSSEDFAALIGRWQVARYEKQLGEDAPGLREALYFRRVAPGASSVLQLMSDPALALVARVGLGLPSQFSGLEFAQQRAILEARVDLKTFSDPRRMDAFLRRFLIRYEQEYGGAQAASPLAPLLSSDGGTTGLYALLGTSLNLRV